MDCFPAVQVHTLLQAIFNTRKITQGVHRISQLPGDQMGAWVVLFIIWPLMLGKVAARNRDFNSKTLGILIVADLLLHGVHFYIYGVIKVVWM